MSATTVEIAIVEASADEQGAYLVRSPAVGILSAVPRVAEYMNPLARIGMLEVLGRRRPLVLPRGISGCVVERLVTGTHVPVAYHQPLLRLAPRSLGAQQSSDGPETSGRGRAGAAASELIQVTSPSEGVFYRKPSPDSPCYVDPGSTVVIGTVLGLVEVMKSFNQITFGGPDLPERGVVEQVLVDDAAEVTFGQPLFRVRAS